MIRSPDDQSFIGTHQLREYVSVEVGFMTVRTRFAPSPTGYMHIGGMRTALFNWLWAKHNNGTFVLRIDDTDQQRNMDEALGPIFKAFEWLEMNWDEGPNVGGDFGPYFQSQRSELYDQAKEKLLAAGKAYRDFDPPEKTKADRELAEKEKRPFLNDRRWLEASESDIEKELAAGTPFVLRLVVPRDEKIVVDDIVRGHVEFDGGLMADPVIVRSNGAPLYNFASVVDDGEMKITHIIRAEEHFSNMPVQTLLFHALGYELPQFAHIPFVAAPGGKKKLSKRDLEKYRKSPQFKKLFELADEVFPKLGLESHVSLDPVMVEYYEKIGFLPDGLLNGLSRLGWSLDDKTEYMSRSFIVENFTLDRVVKSAASFDPEKLLSYQAHWMNELDAETKLNECLRYLSDAKYIGEEPTDEEKTLVEKLIPAVGDRLVVFSDILKFDEFFTADSDLQFEEKAFKKRILKPEDAVPLLKKLREKLSDCDDWNAEPLDQFAHQFVEDEGIGIGQIIHALRIAVTGKSAGIGMFDAMSLIGRESCLTRIDRAVQTAENSGQDD